jgi:hypothetical protein
MANATRAKVQTLSIVLEVEVPNAPTAAARVVLESRVISTFVVF